MSTYRKAIVSEGMKGMIHFGNKARLPNYPCVVYLVKPRQKPRILMLTDG